MSVSHPPSGNYNVYPGSYQGDVCEHFNFSSFPPKLARTALRLQGRAQTAIVHSHLSSCGL
jgi:hypothetical protein